MKTITLMSIGVSIMLIMSNLAQASESEVVRLHDFDMSKFTHLEISNGVGAIEMIQGTGDNLQVEVEIEGNRQGWLRRIKDVSDVDLEVRERRNTLFLSLEEDDVKAQWTIRVPAGMTLENTHLTQGVGEVFVDSPSSPLFIKLGVGEVDVEFPELQAGRIDLRTGVGEVRIHGGDIINRKKAMVTESVLAEGQGSMAVEVQLGVGEINLDLY